MLAAEELRGKAVEYRAAAKTARDAKTHDLYLSVAKYLDEWAAQAEARYAASPAAPHSGPVARARRPGS